MAGRCLRRQGRAAQQMQVLSSSPLYNMCLFRLQLLEVVHGNALQRAAAWDASRAAANFAAAVPPLLASLALSGSAVTQVMQPHQLQRNLITCLWDCLDSAT